MEKLLHEQSLRNRKTLKPLKILARSTGVNFFYRTDQNQRDPIKIWNFTLITLSVVGLAAQYQFIWENRHSEMLAYTEAICFSCQALLSVYKLLYFAFRQQRYFDSIQSVQNSEVLIDMEIFALVENFQWMILFTLLLLDLIGRPIIIGDILDILKDSWKDIKRQINYYMISVICTICWYYISCVAYNIYINYHVNPQDYKVVFPTPASFPMWHDKGFSFPYFFLEVVFMGSELHIAGVASISFLGLFIVTSVHGIALLRILRKVISYTTTYRVKDEERVQYLLACTRLYQKVFAYCFEINAIYQHQTVPLFIVSMLVICLLIFQASLGLGTDVMLVIRMFLYLSAAFFEVVMFCYNGQRLTSESERLPLEIYKCNWYNENAEFKCLTRMLIMRTNHSMAIKLGGFTTMSLVTLLAFLRWNSSYFLFLREFNGSN